MDEWRTRGGYRNGDKELSEDRFRQRLLSYADLSPLATAGSVSGSVPTFARPNPRSAWPNRQDWSCPQRVPTFGVGLEKSVELRAAIACVMANRLLELSQLGICGRLQPNC